MVIMQLQCKMNICYNITHMATSKTQCVFDVIHFAILSL